MGHSPSADIVEIGGDGGAAELRAIERDAGRRQPDVKVEAGETVDEFLHLYPAVSRQQIVVVLDFANRQLIECASSLMNA